MKWFILLLASAAPLAAQCTYTVAPTQLTIAANGGSGAISVNTGASCSWSFSSDSTWITLSSPNLASGQVTGSGVLNYAITATTLPSSRLGNIFVSGAGSTFTVPVNQGAAVCSMTLQPNASTISTAGGPGSFGVQTACTWTATSNALWITVPATATGTGNGTVSFTAAPNGCVDPQTGTISVTSQPSQTFTLTENGSPSNLTLSPATLSAPQAGASGRFNVVTGIGCNWSSYTDVSWLHINTSTSGTGNGGIGYTIDPNTGPSRAGNVHVGAQLFAVTQAGVATPTVQLNTVGSAASYATAAVAPGEIVSLFGTNIGPTSSVGLQLANGGKSITNTLGGVQVLFDGAAVPLIFVSATQINAIAPVGLAGKTSTQVQVTYTGLTSNTVTVPVQPTAPGIFAADGSGSGGGAILNQDYSVNVRLNPAARGSVVAIYLTGAGVTNPASVDGAVTGGTAPFPALTQAVTVTIGGVAVPAAGIVYSGAAPVTVEGLTQIDVVIPAAVSPGPTVPVLVTIGGVASQSGITLSVN